MCEVVFRSLPDFSGRAPSPQLFANKSKQSLGIVTEICTLRKRTNMATGT